MTNKALFQYLIGKWKLFGVVGVAAILLSTIVSMPAVIPPKYESEAIFYPSNLVNFSEESPTEQMLQILESNDLKDSIIRIYNLARAYDIDSTTSGYRTLLMKELAEHVSIGKTEYESVQIKVRDESPERAKAMVGEFIRLVNNHIRDIQRKKDYEYLTLASEEMARILDQLDSIKSQLRTLRVETGLIEYGQAEVVTEQYLAMLRRGESGQKLEIAEKLYESLKSEGGQLAMLTSQFDFAIANYGQVKSKYETALTNVQKQLTYANMVMYPTLPDKKVYPVRWLIVALTTFSALLLTAVLIVGTAERE